RAVGLRVDRRAGLRDRARGDPVHRGDRGGREPAHRPPVRVRGPAHQVRLMATTLTAVRPVAVAAARGQSPAAAARRPRRASPAAGGGVFIVCCFFLMAVVTPVVHQYDAKTDSNLAERLRPPTAEHPLGTDSLGRDILVRVLHATWVSLGLGVSSVAVAALAGSLLGLIAGYAGGRVGLGRL